MTLWRSDRLSIARVVDLDGVRFPAAMIYPDAAPAAMRLLLARWGSDFIDAESLDLLLSFHTFVVRTERQVILVDTCVGNDKDRPTRPSWHRRDGTFLADLAAIGVRPEDVDVVLCTHLHADHVGWNTRLVDGRWVPTFPRARYLIAAAEFDYWRRQHEATPAAPVAYGSFADSVLPVVASGQAEMVAGDYEIESGVSLEPAPGHTPGNIMLHVAEGARRAILCGDVLHHPVQLTHPDWSTHFCADPVRSRHCRHALLARCADTETRLLTAHFQAPTGGRVVRDGKAYGFIFDR